MKITKETLHKIAHLARLEIKEEDESSIVADMENILTWVEKLNELDTEGVEPITNMSQEVNALREDEPGNQLDHKEALDNAPVKDKDYFRVPKFLD